MQYGYTSVPHLARVDITGPYNATGPGDTPSRRRIFVCRPSAAAERDAVRAPDLHEPRRAVRSAAPRRTPIVQSLMRFYQEERSNTGTLRRRNRDGAAPHPRRSGIRLPLRAAAGRRSRPAPPYRITDPSSPRACPSSSGPAIPDDELLTLAIQGKLHEPAVLERQTRRMLADPRSRALVTNFANQWLYLRDLKNANPDVERCFPTSTTTCARLSSAKRRCCSRASCARTAPVLDLLDADYTFVNERLARHYGIPNVYGPDFRRVPVPSDARRGLLGQGSLLLVTSNANRTSPVHTRQVDPGEPARQPASAAAARRAAAQGEPERRRRRLGARADRGASRESGVRRLPQDHGPHRPGARELRRRRPMAHRAIRG